MIGGRRKADREMCARVMADVEVVQSLLDQARMQFAAHIRVFCAQQRTIARLSELLAGLEDRLADEEVQEVVDALEDASAVMAEQL